MRLSIDLFLRFEDSLASFFLPALLGVPGSDSSTFRDPRFERPERLEFPEFTLPSSGISDDFGLSSPFFFFFIVEASWSSLSFDFVQLLL
jgi:hypothetical protein